MAKFFLTFRLQFLTIFYTVQLCLAKPVLKKIAFTAENNMEQAIIDESRLKEIMKKALIEVFEERKNLFYEMVAEVLEDIALVNAIKEGEDEESVSRDEVFSLLEAKA
jgi:hypothetical protein